METAYRELLDRLIAHGSNDSIDLQLDDAFDIKVVVHGSEWDDKVDYRIARFVLDIQSAIDQIYFEACDTTLDTESRFLVKVRHEKGSSDLTVEITKLLNRMVANLTNRQKVFLIVLGIACMAGYFTIGKVLEYKSTINTKIQDEETKREFAKVFDRLALLDHDKPLRSLINSMEENDRIKLPVFSSELSKQEAKKLYPRRQRSVSNTENIDGRYRLLNISYEDPFTATLEKDGVTFKARISIKPNEQDIFYSKIKMLQSSGCENVELDLQVKARYTKHAIREAVIVGVGSPRDGAISIARAVGAIDGKRTSSND